MVTKSARQRDAVFRALADPTRREILNILRSGQQTVGGIAGNFRMSRPAISKHLRVLERAGLISRSRDAQRRPCRLEAKPLELASEWLAHYRELWEANFERLDQLLARMKTEERHQKAKKKRR